MRRKKIFCFGDSNTWGINAADGSRFDEFTRWPKVLESALGDFTIIEEGLNGRTLLDLNPENREAGGISWIEKAAAPHLPIDITIIALGMNDVFDPSEVSLNTIADGMKTLIRKIRDLHRTSFFVHPEIILAAPPEIRRDFDGAQFFELQINKMTALGPLYREISISESVRFFDSSAYIKTSGIDCSHIDGENHRVLGRKLALFIKEISP